MKNKKRFGFIALLGATNSGKSTLLNYFVKEKISITSRKVQTTRMRLCGIRIYKNSQLAFIDTPGIFTPKRRLDKAMVKLAFEQGVQADKILILHDCQKKINEKQFQQFNELKGEKILLLNKVDLVAKDSLLELAKQAGELCQFSQTFFISALKGDGCNEVLEYLSQTIQEGEWLYGENQIYDLPDILLAAEITREKILDRLHQEIPYMIHVVPENFIQRSDKSFEFHQLIYVKSQSHKKIVLGKGGSVIKAISIAARQKMAKLFKRKTHLFLRVKLKENWLEDKALFNSIGLDYNVKD